MRLKRCRFGSELILLGALTIVFARVIEAQASEVWTKILEVAAEQIAQAGINFAMEQLKEYVASRNSPGTPEGNFREALDYYRGTNGHLLDEAKAVEYATLSANAGYSPAQDFLGDLSMRNFDYGKARTWYTMAAKYEAHAQFQLGNLAYSGRLGSPDFETALYWYRMAAGRRYSNAEYQVAAILMTGQAHPPSEAEKVEAANDLEDAANQGLAAIPFT